MSRDRIAKKMKDLRLQQGMTAKEVGRLLGKSEKTICAWETGRGQPDLDLFFTLCRLYQVKDVQAAFDDHMGPQPSPTIQEARFLLRYRRLDDYGRDLLETVLDKECQRCEETQGHGMVAARDGGVRAADQEERKDMEAVYDKLMRKKEER